MTKCSQPPLNLLSKETDFRKASAERLKAQGNPAEELESLLPVNLLKARATEAASTDIPATAIA
jgi:hypothetical protein